MLAHRHHPACRYAEAPNDTDLALVVMVDGRHFIKRWWRGGKGEVLLESIGARDPRFPKRPDPDLMVKEEEIRTAHRVIMIDLRGSGKR